MRTAISLTVLATLLACSLASAPADARARTFVASYGNDSNPCTFGSPCKTFQQAVNVVDIGGEVTAIDSAGFGPIEITKAVTITSPPGVEAGIVPTSGNPAIVIAPGGGTVQLRGLTLDGEIGGTDGVQFVGVDTRIEIIDCLIHNFSGDGIVLNALESLGAPASTAFISNTISSNNRNGIEINQGQSSVRGAIDHVTTSGNSASGIVIDGVNATGNFIDLVISNSVSDSNSGDGITVVGAGNVKVELRDSTLSNNTFNGITVSNAIVGLYANSIVLDNAGFSVVSSGLIRSFGNNVIDNNRNASTGSLTQASVQ